MFLVHKLKLVSIAGNLCAAATNDTAVLIAMIASHDAVQIDLNVPISSIGNKKPCVSHNVLLFSFRMVNPSRLALVHPAVAGAYS